MRELWGGLAALAIIGSLLLATMTGAWFLQLFGHGGGHSAALLQQLWQLSAALGGGGLLLAFFTPLSARKSGRPWVHLFILPPALAVLLNFGLLLALALAPAWIEGRVVRASMADFPATLSRGQNMRDLNLAAAYFERHGSSTEAVQLAEELLLRNLWVHPERIAEQVIALYLKAPQQRAGLLVNLRQRAGRLPNNTKSRAVRQRLFQLALSEAPQVTRRSILGRQIKASGTRGVTCIEVAVSAGPEADEGTALKLTAVAQELRAALDRGAGIRPEVRVADNAGKGACIRLSPTPASGGPFVPLARIREAPDRWRPMDITAELAAGVGAATERVLVEKGYGLAGPAKDLWAQKWQAAGKKTRTFAEGARHTALRVLWTLLQTPAST